jgi:hypothetical protein
MLKWKFLAVLSTCSNNGYDYADLFTPDGAFIDKDTDEASWPTSVRAASSVTAATETYR